VFDACTQRTVVPEPGTLSYSFGTVPAGGYTLMGAPTVISKMSVANGGESQVAARLWEVSNNKQRLIARGVYRPDASGPQVFQLHGNAYKFEPGTEIRLQLLPRDADPLLPGFSYVRGSNDQQDVTVSKVEIRLPVAEAPGSRPGVKAPLAKVLPQGSMVAPDYASIGAVPISQWANPTSPPGQLSVKGPMTATGKTVTAKLVCSKSGRCGPATIEVRRSNSRGFIIASGRGLRLAAGKSKTVSLKMTPRGRKLLRGKGPRTVRVYWKNRGNSKSDGITKLRRVGRVR
jgi:urease beta subunit